MSQYIINNIIGRFSLRTRTSKTTWKWRINCVARPYMGTSRHLFAIFSSLGLLHHSLPAHLNHLRQSIHHFLKTRRNLPSPNIQRWINIAYSIVVIIIVTQGDIHRWCAFLLLLLMCSLIMLFCCSYVLMLFAVCCFLIISILCHQSLQV